MNLQKMIDEYVSEGLTVALASSRVCQDIVLKAIAGSVLSDNVTIKGGVVMRSITDDIRRATSDIDLDFIHYSLSDESIRTFVNKLNCIDGLNIEMTGRITELKHQDYHGKSIDIHIRDDNETVIKSKIDIGVHNNMNIEQEEYCFDVCMDDEGATLLKNTVEQSFVEKLRSLLKFGPNSRRYKDIYDMYYLSSIVSPDKTKEMMSVLIFDDDGMFENNMNDIIKRIDNTFSDEQYLSRVSDSRQRWLDDDIHKIADGILAFLNGLM